MSEIALSGEQVARKVSVPRFLALRFALRELRGGLSGFYVLIACIALGVAAIAGVNSVSRGMTQSIQSEGQSILGGDLEFSRIHTRASEEERAFLESSGLMSEVATTRVIVRVPGALASGEASARSQLLVDLKSVDDLYPLYDRLTLVDGGDLQDRLSEQDGVHGLVVAPEVLSQLDLELGDLVQLGLATYEVRGAIASEPDSLSLGLSFGPRVIVSEAGLAASDLVKPGSLVTWRYRVRLSATGFASDGAVERFKTDAEEAFPFAGWRITERTNAAPGLSSSIGRFAQFLTLVGLTALIAGGVGVANAVAAFIDSKREVIATFKCLGARGGFVVRVYLIQILLIAGIGIALGVVLGALMPLVAATFLSGLIPVGAMRGVFPAELALAVVYGFLTALAFALWPLGRAHDIRPTALFRDKSGASVTRPRVQYVVATLITVAALAGLAILLADSTQLAAYVLAAVAFMLVILRGVAILIEWTAKRTPRPSNTELRLAIGNIHRPGALTTSVVLSLGLGLAVLVTLSLIDVNMRTQLTSNIPDQAPSFFFLDIQESEKEDFLALLDEEAPSVVLDEAPMLRGRIISMRGVKSADHDQTSDEAWVLRGDRGITFRAAPPTTGTLVQGDWWPADTTERLVSLDHDVAEAFDVNVGDELTVNVLGREITATVANTRIIEWQTLTINFVMIFSPPTFAGAPHPTLVTTTFPKTAEGRVVSDEALVEQELALLSAVTNQFPTVTPVRVKDALDSVNSLIGNLAVAVRAAAAVTLIASIFVLAGALAAGQRQRIHDAIILKMLGAVRRRIITAFVLEYAILGFATALFALLAGTLAAYAVLEFVMQIGFTLHASVVAATVLVALLLTVTFGMVGTWRALGQKPASVLRNL